MGDAKSAAQCWARRLCLSFLFVALACGYAPRAVAEDSTTPAPLPTFPEARSLIDQALALWDTSKRIPSLTETDLQAKALLERVVNEFAGTQEAAEALRHLGFGHYYKHLPEEAVTYWNRLFSEYPTSPQCATGWLDMGEYYFNLGDFASATRCCTNIIAKFADTDQGHQAFIDRAFVSMAALDYQAAAEDLKHASETDVNPERRAKAVFSCFCRRPGSPPVLAESGMRYGEEDLG